MSTNAIAETYHQRWDSDSKPVLLTASDGRDYVVKGFQKDQVLVNDRVVGPLGALAYLDALVAHAYGGFAGCGFIKANYPLPLPGYSREPILVGA